MPLTDHKARPRSPEDITTVMTTVESRYAAHVVPPADEFAMAGPLPQRSSIQSVERALAILEVLGGAHGPLRLGEVAQRCGINTSTCHHLLDTLVGRGYVSRAATGLGYRLGRQAWVWAVRCWGDGLLCAEPACQRGAAFAVAAGAKAGVVAVVSGVGGLAVVFGCL
jgi:predicted transcriptional regulator